MRKVFHQKMNKHTYKFHDSKAFLEENYGKCGNQEKQEELRMPVPPERNMKGVLHTGIINHPTA